MRNSLLDLDLHEPMLIPAKAVTGAPAVNSKLVRLNALGLVPGIAGGATGVNASGDVITQTSDGVSVNDLWNEFQQSLEYYNQRRQTLIDLLSFSVTQNITRVYLPGGEQDFERASEFGEPVGIRTESNWQSMGYTFDWWDLAIRYSWMFLADAEASQVESLNASALNADTRLLFRKVMEAIFRNVTRSGLADGTAINVYPFYNGDGWVPPQFKNYEHDGTHTHYLTSGAATVVSEDLDEIVTHLRHHGYGDTPGAAQIILLANEQEVSTIRTFRVSAGDQYDFIPPQGTTFPRFLTSSEQAIEGGQPAQQLAGLEVAGQYGPVLVVQESWIPAGYLFAFATGGTETAGNPVGIREHANTNLRGLRLVKGPDSDYPLIDSFYQRGFGTGVRHRGNGVVMQVTTNANYAIPTEYSTAA